MARKKVFGIAGSNKEVFGIAGSNKEVFGITDLGEKVPIGTTTVAIQAGTKLIIGSTPDSITPGTKIEIGSIVNPQDLSSLTIMGEWENPQFINSNVDTTGIVIAANYGEYFSRLVEPTLSRNTWGGTPGEQSITFSYTEGGITVSATATVNINKKLTGLNINGDWVTQYYNNPVDTTGLSFMASYDYGNPVSITPSTISPSVWGGTGTQTATFTYTENGVSVSATKDANVINPNWSSWKNVGGTIFYIDASSDCLYEFKDSNGTKVSAPSVGDDCTGWTYRYDLDSYTVDKFYVYNTSAIFKRDRTGAQADPYIIWTYLDTANQSYIDYTTYTSGLPSGKQEWEYYGFAGRVFESLDGTYTNTAIGTGKTNTYNIMSLRNGVYIQGSQINWKNQTKYSETIWYICDQFNKGTYSLNGSLIPNNTGCSDWYIPSKDELETMKNAIGAKNFASMLYSGGSISSVLINPWSSSAYSSVSDSWFWFWNFGNDFGSGYGYRSGTSDYCLALSRSF